MATPEEIRAWADGIGLDVCIGELFAAEHDGRLPQTNTELCQWAHTTGRRSDTGVWICKSSVAVPDIWESVQSWLASHPTWTIGLAIGLFLVLKPGRRR